MSDKVYGRKIVKGYKNEVVKRLFISWGVCILIGLVIGAILFWGISLLFKEEPIEPKEVTMVEEPMIELEPTIEVEPTITSLGEYKLTAYCSCERCCGEWSVDRPLDREGNPIIYTANMSVATQGVTVAADTDVLPFDSKILIDGHEYTVQDRGGAIKGNRIDVYFESHEEALQFGVQYKEIFLKGDDV